MRTIDITQILSPDLKSRVRVDDLMLFIKNSQEKAVVIDFSNVKFATRSFIDEFYNVFMKKNGISSVQGKDYQCPGGYQNDFRVCQPYSNQG